MNSTCARTGQRRSDESSHVQGLLDAQKLPNINFIITRTRPVFEGRKRRTLQRLARESSWLRRAARAARGEPVDLTAIQVLAVMALEPSATFEGTGDRLGLNKEQLSRALRSLRSAGLVGKAEGRYFRDRLPPVTKKGISVLDRIVDDLEGR